MSFSTREHAFLIMLLDCLPVLPLGRLIRVYEDLAALVRPASVRGIAVNTAHLGPDVADGQLEAVERETGLPAEDVVRHGAARLADALVRGARAHTTAG